MVESVPAFAAALRDLADGGARSRMGGAGRLGSAEFSELTMVRKYLALYERLAGARSGSRPSTGAG